MEYVIDLGQGYYVRPRSDLGQTVTRNIDEAQRFESWLAADRERRLTGRTGASIVRVEGR